MGVIGRKNACDAYNFKRGVQCSLIYPSSQSLILTFFKTFLLFKNQVNYLKCRCYLKNLGELLVGNMCLMF